MTYRQLTLILLCFGQVMLSHAQNYLFSIGAAYRTFAYQNYNKYDWNNLPDSYPSGTGQLNGSAYGLKVQIPVNDKFKITIGTLFGNQSQHFKSYTVITNHGDSLNEKYFYNTDVEASFHMINVPVYLTFNSELGYKSGLYLNFNLGPQISFLTNYESSSTNYAFDFFAERILYDSILNYIHQTPGKIYQRILQGSPPVYNEFYHDVPYQYNKVLFGVTGEVEIQKLIGDRLLIGLGFFTDYDFTQSEESSFYVYPYLAGSGGKDRSDSHNFRIGLSLSAQYVFY